MTRGVYVVTYSATLATAITVLQVKAGASSALEILRATVSQSTSETSEQLAIRLLRKTAAATVTSFTPLKLNPLDGAAAAVGGTAATGHTATAEGTDGDILVDEGFNVLNGWNWLPTPEERIVVPAAGLIALKFPNAPTSATFKAQIFFREIG